MKSKRAELKKETCKKAKVLDYSGTAIREEFLKRRCTTTHGTPPRKKKKRDIARATIDVTSDA